MANRASRLSGPRVFTVEEINAEGWVHTLSWLSRHVGLDAFCGGEARKMQYLTAAFGHDHQGKQRIARALAVDAAFAARRILNAVAVNAEGDDEAPPPAVGEDGIDPQVVAGVLRNMQKLREALGTCGKKSRNSAAQLLSHVVDLLLAAFVCALMGSVPWGEQRAVAFALAVERSPARARLPCSFEKLYTQARQLRKGDDTETFMLELEALNDTYHPRKALNLARERLDYIRLEANWTQQAINLMAKFKAGVVVDYEELRRRGEKLLENGEWIRATAKSPRKGEPEPKPQAQAQAAATPNGRPTVRPKRKASAVPNGKSTRPPKPQARARTNDETPLRSKRTRRNASRPKPAPAPEPTTMEEVEESEVEVVNPPSKSLRRQNRQSMPVAKDEWVENEIEEETPQPPRRSTVPKAKGKRKFTETNGHGGGGGGSKPNGFSKRVKRRSGSGPLMGQRFKKMGKNDEDVSGLL